MFTRTFSRSPQPSSPSAAPSFEPQRFIQPRLIVGPVDDPYEREADQMAERVVQRVPGPLGLSRVGSPTVQRENCTVADGGVCQAGSKHERQEDEDEEPGSPGKVARREALPTPSPGPAGATVASGVEAGIHQAQGGGSPLAEPVRGTMERAFGADFHLVRVHSDSGSDRLNRSLAARAFTTGRDIFFRNGEYRPESRVGQRLLAHELTHVVQQGAAGKEIVQRQFEGPQFDNANLADEEYPIHAFQLVDPVQDDTDCGTKNRITTAGEKVNAKKSKPGDPTGFATYRDGYSVTGGLVKDKNLDQAATRMHLINHRLENSDNTQQNPNNIMMGTKESNNPAHLNWVETPVINAVKTYGSKHNGLYEAAMKNAVETQDSAGKEALFWPEKDEPDTDGVRSYAEVYLIDKDATKGYRLPADKKNGDEKGFGFTTEGYDPPDKYYHLWLMYTVKANYTGRPGYVDENIKRESEAAPDALKEAEDALEQAELAFKDAQANKKGEARAKAKVVAREKDVENARGIDQKINDFKNGWADHAFPANFTCDATYYTATYKKWGKGSYRVESEDMTIDSAL